MGTDIEQRRIWMVPQRTSSLLLGACGAWLILLGVYFIVLRPPLLAEDLRYIAITEAFARDAMPGLPDWLQFVFIVLGGFAASSGVALAYLSVWVLPRRPKGAGLVVAVMVLLGPALMCVVNFALHSDFRWLLLAPAVFGLAGVFAYMHGR